MPRTKMEQYRDRVSTRKVILHTRQGGRTTEDERKKNLEYFYRPAYADMPKRNKT